MNHGSTAEHGGVVVAIVAESGKSQVVVDVAPVCGGRRNGQDAQERDQHKHQRKRSLQVGKSPSVGETPTAGHVKMFVVTHAVENTSF